MDFVKFLSFIACLIVCISLAEAIKPTNLAREVVCEGCHAVIAEANAVLAGSKRGTAQIRQAMQNICQVNRLTKYEFSPPNMKKACDYWKDNYSQEIMDVLADSGDEEYQEIQLCFVQTDVCQGVDRSGFRINKYTGPSITKIREALREAEGEEEEAVDDGEAKEEETVEEVVTTDEEAETGEEVFTTDEEEDEEVADEGEEAEVISSDEEGEAAEEKEEAAKTKNKKGKGKREDKNKGGKKNKDGKKKGKGGKEEKEGKKGKDEKKGKESKKGKDEKKGKDGKKVKDGKKGKDNKKDEKKKDKKDGKQGKKSKKGKKDEL